MGTWSKLELPRRGRAGWIVLMVIALLVASSAALAQVWTNLRAIELGYTISRARQARRKVLEINRRLRIEVALLKNPQRISEMAREMGYRPPEPEQVRRVQLADHERRRRASPTTTVKALIEPAFEAPPHRYVMAPLEAPVAVLSRSRR